MAEFNLKTSQDIEDFLTGCAFYGTGGGGDVKAGRVSLQNCLEQGLEMRVTDPDKVGDDDLYCTAVFVGSIAPKTKEIIDEMENGGFRAVDQKYHLEEMLIAAVKGMEKYLGKKMDGLAVAEMGGSNTACCMAAAYQLGIKVYDGDPAGRAIPSDENYIPTNLTDRIGPDSVYIDPWGNSGISLESANVSAKERISKKLSEASYGTYAEATLVRTGKQLKETLIPHTISNAYNVGKAINEAAAKGEDPCMAAAEASGGKVIGYGVIQTLKSSDHDGYYWGEHTIVGTGKSETKTFRIWFKNENHVLWCNETPIATSPDLICLINLDTKQPLLNTYLAEGQRVGIVTVPAGEQYKTSEAIAVFNPRTFDFDFDYVPYDSVNI